MSLEDLPRELLFYSLRFVVEDVGIRSAINLRLVCRAFDRDILNSVFALPAFEGSADWDPADPLNPGSYMTPELIAKLILTKLEHADAEKRRITIAIADTLKFLSDNTTCNIEVAKRRYSYALALSAAQNLSVRAVTKFLRPLTEQREPAQSVALHALVAATICGDGHDITANILSFLPSGSLRSEFFGSALSAAVRTANIKSLALFLQLVLPQPEKGSVQHVSWDVNEAMITAAANGQTESIRILLEHYPLNHRKNGFYRLAIKQAIQTGHTATAQVLLHGYDACEIEQYLWSDLLRAGVASKLVNVVQFVIDHPQFTPSNRTFDLAIEDASRMELFHILKTLLSRCAEYSTVSHAGALYWAARNRNKKILNFILNTVLDDEKLSLEDAILDALSGATIGDSEICCFVLEKANIAIPKALSSKGSEAFRQIIDDPSVFPIRTHKTDKTSISRIIGKESQEAKIEQLRKVCKENKAYALRQIMSSYRLNQPDVASVPFRGCCSLAASGNRPASLLYLLQSPFSYLSSEAAIKARSTVVFQIFLDNGWDVNDVFDRLKPPPLGHVLSDDFLTFWLLGRGANPDTRGGWDITAMSAAVQKGLISAFYLLRRHGGDVHQGQLLHFAVQCPDEGEAIMLIDWLLTLGLEINALQYQNDSKSWIENKAIGMGTPLHVAVKLARIETVKFLLRRGADPDLVDSLGRTVLYLAETRGLAKIVDILKTNRDERQTN